MDTNALRAIVERPRKCSMWGYEKVITPLLVDAVLGDGEKLIYFEPIMTRPNFFVVRIDSKWTISNSDDVPEDGLGPEDWNDLVWDAIVEQFGVVGCPNDNDHTEWPVVDCADGVSWGEIELGYFNSDIVEAS